MDYKTNRVHSVEKALFLLDCFWQERSELSLTELVQKTGWAKSSVHATLSSLLTNAMVEQDPQSGKYYLGYHAFELGCVAQERWHVRPVAAHYMRRVTERTGESMYLAKRCGNDAVLIENSEALSDFKVTSPWGARMPLYACSQGKILLAQLEPEELERYLQSVEMKRYTQYTITDPERLRMELNMVRVQGFATEYSELCTGLRSIAAPIYAKPDSKCEYAISAVTTARSGMTGDNLRKLQDMVIQAAKDISDMLQTGGGWRLR